MAVKDLLTKFRSISRPSLGKSSGTSSTYSSYAKKQLAAEDAILDNQYEAGTLSPEAYLSALNSRLTRTSNTPLTNVNLQEKIQKTQVKVNDAIVANKQASGEYSASDVLAYEQQKLGRMTETGSPAYLQQQQKITQLQNKVEKDARTAYRNSEMLRISQLPGDNSATLWEKAQVYKTLSDQARLDGDTQQADTLATQYNNAVTSAKRADVNDVITGARLSISGTPTTGLGTPTSQAGESRLTSGGQVQGGGSTAGEGSSKGTASSAVTTGFTGASNTAVNNAMKTLDSKYKSYEKTANAINDDNTMIEKYKEAISQSEGDQKTQLTIAYNNLVDSKAQKENSLGILEQGINDTVTRIQELQEKAASGAFTQEVRKTNQQFNKAETDLETAFAKGEINKEEYIVKGAQLAATKKEYFGQASDVFNQYGNDSNAESYLEKAAQMEQIHQSLVNTATNLDNWEPIAADPGGKLTNLFGKQVQPGDVSLVDVTKLKDSGDFDANYTNDNGVYKRVYYPGQQSLVGDGYVSKAVAQELSKNSTDPANAPFVYSKSSAPGGIGPTTGEVKKQPLTKTSNGLWVTPTSYETMKTTANSSLDQVLGKVNQTQQLVDQTKKGTTSTKVPSLIDRLFTPLSSTPKQEKSGGIISSISNALGGAKNWFGNAVSSAKDIFSNAKDTMASAAGNVNLPPLVKKAYATYSDTTDAQIRQWAERAQAETGVDADLIIAQYKLESGNGASAPGNNYFGMKGTGPAGSQSLLTTENRNGKNVKVYQNFRKYNSPEESFIDHARLISKDPRYADVLAASKTGDKGAVADAIGRSPYATDPNYGAKIRQLMGLGDTSNLIASVGSASSGTPNLPTNYASFTDKTGSTTTSTRLTPQIKPAGQSTPSFVPPVQRIEPNFSTPTYSQPSQQPNTSFTNTVIKPAVQKVQAYVAPKIQAVAKAAAPVIQNVQQKASNFVSNAISSTKNWLGNLFKKK